MGQARRFLLRTYAKLNLCLDVLRRREDGFHELESLFQNVSMHDELEVTLADGQGRIVIDSDVPIEQNTIAKVWELARLERLDCHVELRKRIPLGAGLGGGSSNAGGFIGLLIQLGYVTRQEGFELAKRIGSDVPFFLEGGTAIVKGKGDIIESLEPLQGLRVDIFYPGYHISTKWAYANLDPRNFSKAPLKPEELYEAYREANVEKIRFGTYNVFETIVPADLRSAIGELRERWPAALTGSGSAYFCVRPNGAYEFVSHGFEIFEL